jgi:hypothetical protein
MAEITAFIVLGLPYPNVYSVLGGVQMIKAHRHEALLYGLLVTENVFLVINEDLLGFPTYFPEFG